MLQSSVWFVTSKKNYGYGLIIQYLAPEIDFKDCERFILLQDKLSDL